MIHSAYARPAEHGVSAWSHAAHPRHQQGGDYASKQSWSNAWSQSWSSSWSNSWSHSWGAKHAPMIQHALHQVLGGSWGGHQPSGGSHKPDWSTHQSKGGGEHQSSWSWKTSDWSSKHAGGADHQSDSGSHKMAWNSHQPEGSQKTYTHVYYVDGGGHKPEHAKPESHAHKGSKGAY